MTQVTNPETSTQTPKFTGDSTIGEVGLSFGYNGKGTRPESVTPDEWAAILHTAYEQKPKPSSLKKPDDMEQVRFDEIKAAIVEMEHAHTKEGVDAYNTTKHQDREAARNKLEQGYGFKGLG